MLVLGVESSCDDLSMALLRDGRAIACVTSSQAQDHLPYGGVVPEIASRRHLENLELTLDYLLQSSGIALGELEGIAATYAPGLVGSLLVGLNFAKTLAFALEKPFRGVHHIEAHLWSPFLEALPRFPFLGLVVSGGHTHLYRVTAFGEYALLGHTVDDAIGEAFDKVAKLMGIPYPGGPEIDRLAEFGDSKAFAFTLPQVRGKPLHTSFSGLKTAAADYVACGEIDDRFRADLAASFQSIAVQAVRRMLQRAWERFPSAQVALAGGVACNRGLRKMLREFSEEQGVEVCVPSPKFCTDNGAMVAYVGEKYLERGEFSPWSLNAEARKALGA